MKKRVLTLVCLLTLLMSLVACEKNNNKIDNAVVYSKYNFTDINWIRETETCTENIRFKANGDFSYFCSCGNSVNDADLIEGYTYNAKTQVITFDTLENTDSMITSVTVVSCDGKKLVLDFDGDQREFTSEDDYTHTEEIDYNEFSFTNMDWKRDIKDCTEIINFGPFGSFSYYCLCRDHKDYSTISDKYTYDSKTGIVTLNIIAEDIDGITDSLKIVSYESEKLVIELDGETLEFTPVNIE